MNSFFKNNTLILTQTDPSSDLIFKQWEYYGLNAAVLFFALPKPFRAIRRIWLLFNFPFSFIWLGNWKKDILKYNCFIVHASEMTGTVAKWIHHFNPSARVIYWYWNPVNQYSAPSRVKDDKVEFWTFDDKDAQKYHMQKNIQYYCPPISFCGDENIKYDVYFIGHDKGRKSQIFDLIKKMKLDSISCRLDLINKNDEFIPYKDVCERVIHSKAILEINQKGQSGLTLRAMESLFFGKKLITNNKAIKNSKFYNQNNIFILGEDRWNDIKGFINSPYDHSVDKFKNYYDIYTWFNNFFK